MARTADALQLKAIFLERKVFVARSGCPLRLLLLLLVGRVKACTTDLEAALRHAEPRTVTEEACRQEVAGGESCHPDI